MRCPFCDANRDRVVDSRESRDGAVIRRRRECLNCNRRFTSYEQIEEVQYMVVKHDGRREEFSRNKLLEGLRTAARKRPISTRHLEEIVDATENLLHQREDREISTQDIGAFVMDRLKTIDQVAYVRFVAATSFPESWAVIDYGQTGYAQRPPRPRFDDFLGLDLAPATDGTRIVDVAPGSAADRAGLEAGDLIVRIDTVFGPSATATRRILAGKSRGEFAFLRVRRGPHELALKIQA
jgi:transcriptional repressor NrdR